MKICDLSQSLGISRQMTGKLKKWGMPVDSLEAAIEWRKRNIDPFRSKTGRIGGNTGVKYQPKKINKSMLYVDVVSMVKELGDHEYKIAKKMLTHAVPVIWFTQIQRLGIALRDHSITISAEDLVKVQTILFLIYMIDMDKFINTENHYEFPDTLKIRPNDEAYPSLIECLSKVLSEELYES